MSQQQRESIQDEKYYADELLSLGMAGQSIILEEQLKAGISLTYHNDNGDLIQRYPNGTVKILKEKEI